MDMLMEKKVEPSKKKHDAKKPGKPSGPPDSRGRAKSTLVNPFDNKKAPGAKKVDSKPMETIGENRFKNLLSMFDKKADGDNKENNDGQGPRKLDTSKFTAFSNGGIKTSDVNLPQNEQGKPSGVTEGIQKRMEALLNVNKNNRNTVSNFDPVLEQRKKMLQENGDDDEYGDDHFGEEDDDFSDEKSGKDDEKDDDSWNDSDSDKKEKIVDKDVPEEKDVPQVKHEEESVENEEKVKAENTYNEVIDIKVEDKKEDSHVESEHLPIDEIKNDIELDVEAQAEADEKKEKINTEWEI